MLPVVSVTHDHEEPGRERPGASCSGSLLGVHVTREPAPPAAVRCRDAVDEALGSVRAEGLEPSSTGLSLCEAIARGELDPEQAVARLTAHYRPHRPA
ncbi:hypothetical protein GCM10010472_43120 [Pseudonocardia halophobica]|uniref:Antitoxin VbhA domain-containing protein n=1 Tax=Pseudonocardia halophobica TaxID=29401 RepID=A0A9W6L2X4_9PSEU|nr:hypothetical protein GCM10017577_22610 [Pseudonocardia halophobica]